MNSILEAIIAGALWLFILGALSDALGKTVMQYRNGLDEWAEYYDAVPSYQSCQRSPLVAHQIFTECGSKNGRNFKFLN